MALCRIMMLRTSSLHSWALDQGSNAITMPRGSAEQALQSREKHEEPAPMKQPTAGPPDQ